MDLQEVQDFADEDETGIVSLYHCPCCGRNYEISDPLKKEKETTYKKYWNS